MEILLILRIFLSLGIINSADTTDPCTAYDTINDWQRSVRYSDISTVTCDSFLKEGWYKVTSQAGEEMPTSCPKNGFKCGTMEPVWLNGTFPASGLTKNLTACSAHFDGDCCKTKYRIQVKNCTGFYVYKLVPTKVCPQAYCFGKELPCRPGYTSKNGFTPGCKYEPCLTENHKPLNNWRRSFGNNNTDITLCDSFLDPGWYKPISKAGNIMPTTCPKDGFRCGTIEPVWLNGTLPSIVNSTVNATACVSSFNRGCCSPYYDIQIRNCGKFNIYKLTNTKACPQGYCFGSEIPCPIGETSVNGYTPGCEFDPCHPSNYQILSGQVKRSSNYTLSKNDLPIDDSTLTTNWYRIKSKTGNDIVMTQQPINQCGTKYPIWMKGSLPNTFIKTVDRKVCMSDVNNFCQVETTIKVRNCGNFTVYYLPTTTTKNAAYCFGTKPYSEDSSEKKTSLIEQHDIPWIVVVSVLAVVIILFIAIFFIKQFTKRTKRDSTVENEKPPPYTPKIEHGMPPLQHKHDQQ